MSLDLTLFEKIAWLGREWTVSGQRSLSGTVSYGYVGRQDLGERAEQILV